MDDKESGCGLEAAGCEPEKSSVSGSQPIARSPQPEIYLTLPVLLMCGLLSLPIWALIGVLLWSVLR